MACDMLFDYFLYQFVKLPKVLYSQVSKVLKPKESIWIYNSNLVVTQISGDKSTNKTLKIHWKQNNCVNKWNNDCNEQRMKKGNKKSMHDNTI